MKDKLLYYEGGGYDGCYWEWNFCFWDADGVWHDLLSSGRAGADTEAKALEVIKNNNGGRFAPTLVDLTDAEQFKQFQKDNNAVLVLGIAKELNDDYNYSIKIHCDACGCDFVADRSECDAAVDNSTIVCYECYELGMCDCCGEYVGTDDINCHGENDEVVIYLEDAGYCNVCNDCYEHNKGILEREKLEDLLWQAFCTGKPDIFCDELREVWDVK